MDVSYVNPFIDATLCVLKTMASTEAEVGKPYIKKDTTAMGDVTSLIGLSGQINGSVSVSFTTESILCVVSRMFGEEMTELNDEVKDAVGEIANMISGQARQKIETMGHSLKAAIPSVIVGTKHSIAHASSYPVVAIPFSTVDGNFTIEVCFLE